MRIHGVQFQGLRIPPGEYRVDLDPGYNVVVAGRAADLLAHVVTTCLLPGGALEELATWAEPDVAAPARLSLGLSFGADAYRIVADLRRSQVVLARYDPSQGLQSRRALGVREVRAELAELGLPDRTSFLALHGCGGIGAVVAAPAGDDTLPVVSPSGLPPTEMDAEGDDLERLKLLRDVRERRDRVEAELSRATQELAEHRGLEGVVTDFEERLQQYRRQLVARDRELATIEATRRGLLDDRARLREVPRSQRGGGWIGLAIGVGGAIAAVLGGAAFYALSVFGFGLGLFFALVRRSAGRRLGRVEARLSGLRVGERSVHQTFDSETRELRTVLSDRGLGSVEDLQREVADYRGLRTRVERLQGELDEAQRAFPSSAERELDQLEEAWRERESSREMPTSPVAPGIVPRAPHVEELIDAASMVSGRSQSEVLERMTPSLSLYVRALTEGRITRIRRGQGLSWELRGEEASTYQPLENLSRAELDAVRMAFRLSLLEGLAPTLRIPLLIGPALHPPTPGQRAALGRALRRLASVVQVLHVTRERAEWDACATSLQHLHGSEVRSA